MNHGRARRSPVRFSPGTSARRSQARVDSPQVFALDAEASIPPGPTETSAGSVVLHIESDPTLGYASMQNAVPVVRLLRLTNGSNASIEDVEVLVSCSPAFAQGIKLRFDRLEAGESRRFSPLDLRPNHAFLADLPESIIASITVSAVAGDQCLAEIVAPLEVLAYDQWAGTRALPELLAAFCMPNHPVVDVLIGRSSKLLRAHRSELSMDGYQSKDREVVWAQVSALYSTLAAEDLQYALPPASFGTDGQKIRTPDRIFDTRVATCLDLALLFASCLEQAGLGPVILMKKGHAWVGVWLHPTSFPDPLTDDVQAVRKRVDTGELLSFETTGIAMHPNHRPSLRIAMEQGHAHLQEEESFIYAVDIHRARQLQIKPLPSRVGPADSEPPAEPEQAAGLEPIPSLPPLDPACLTPEDVPAVDTAQGRLARWKAKLLDLSLRNRLLNFKPTKSTLQFVAPDLGLLEDALADGTGFRLRALPPIMEASDPRVAAVHTVRGGRTPVDDMALEVLDKKELLAHVSKENLEASLLAIFNAARTGLEEGGANTLYLALGMLRWADTAKSETAHLAPILLVPVTLQRESVRSGFWLRRHDDESIVNPTLLQMLRTDFEMNIAGLDVAPVDDKGVDVAWVLQSFRLAVREIKKWEVLEEAHLGIFSFKKFLMWKDLQDRTGDLMANRVVKHLIEHPGKAFVGEGQDERLEHLDAAYGPQDILAPLLSDSSQLKAICAVDAGRDLVLEGPPGTGKSQTITNLIAHSLGKGKTVLFVSEKMAALEVVHRRLAAIGLGPFCLQLHSSRAKKSEVVAQLGEALDIRGERTALEFSQEAQRLAERREELNALVQSLHRRAPNGLSVYEAIGTCIAHEGEEPSSLPWPDALTHDRAALEEMRETTRRLGTLAGGIDIRQGSALAHLGQTQWSPTWQEELLGAAQRLDALIADLRAKAHRLGEALGFPAAGWDLQAYAAMDALADALLAAPKVPVPLARRAQEPLVREQVQQLARHGLSRARHWHRVGPGWDPSLTNLQAAALQAEWARASAALWPLSWLGRRGIRSRLAAYRKDQRRPPAALIETLFGPLADLNAEDQCLSSLETHAEALLQSDYTGVGTDWSTVATHEQWAGAFAGAVTALADSDAQHAHTLRARVQSMVAEDRPLLAPEGPVGRISLEYRDAWRETRHALSGLEQLARPVAPLQGAASARGALERIQGVLAGWQASRRLLQTWCLWRQVREQGIAKGLQSLVTDMESGRVSPAALAPHFDFSYANWWVKKALDADPVLRAFSSADHERRIREFRGADARFQELTERFIAATLASKVPSPGATPVGPDSELGRLRRELQRQRGHLPVRQLVKGLPSLLPRLKPCLLMSPLSVAQYLDPAFAPFDLVVFDEASQIPVWDAVGAIARGKQVVVVGDPKQLPPTSFFSRSADADGEGDADGEVEDLESILDECLGVGMNRMSLQWHYRSRHESLITFSNATYYDSRLITFPSPVTTDSAVRFHRVAGVYDRSGTRTNRAEAEEIVKGIEAHYLSGEQAGLSLGVVTFNQPQQSLVETLLDARRRAIPELDRAIATHGRDPLFIKNLENVQGDERDVIFFSITYGSDASGRMVLNFGPLNAEGGHRRLNVAISRARQAVVVYSSLMPEQIDLARVRATGVRDLKHYLEFALKGPRALAAQSLATGREPESPFEAAVIRALRNRGWEVHPQVGCSGYRLDLGVVDPRAPGRYLLGVECDGRTYHCGANARDRDRLRQHVLEGLGWRIYRLWSTDWWMDSERAIDKLVAHLRELLDLDGEPGFDSRPPAGSQSPHSPPPDNGSPGLADGAPDAPAGEGSLTIYAPVELPPGDPVWFYADRAAATLVAQLTLVVESEGPIVESELCRRVARAWGLERLGARVVERLRQLTPDALGRTRDGELVFYWPTDGVPTSFRRFRVAGDTEASRRRIDQVCLEEIAAMVQHVSYQVGGATRADLARAVGRLLGMARVPADAQARVGLAISLLLSSGRLTEADGVVRSV